MKTLSMNPVSSCVVRLIAFGMLFLPNIASATSIEKAVEQIASTLSGQAKSSRIGTVRIDEIKGPRTGTGRRIASMLAKALEQHGLTVTDDPLDLVPEIRGRFSQHLDGNTPSVRLTVNIFDENGADLNEVREQFTVDTSSGRERLAKDAKRNETDSPSATIKDNDSVVDILQPTFDILSELEGFLADNRSSSDQDLRPGVVKLRDKLVTRALKTPTAILATQSQLSAASGSNFRIELLKRKSITEPFKPVSLSNTNGIGVADLEEGDLYRVRVYNRSRFDIGVAISIDGFNSLGFSEISDYAQTKKWVIPARTAGTVDGFLINEFEMDSFQISKNPQGAVESTLPKATAIGNVCVEVFLAWAPGEAPRLGKVLQDSTPGSSTLRTVRGPRISSPSEKTERIFCEISVAQLVIRYANPAASDGKVGIAQRDDFENRSLLVTTN